MNIAIPVTWFDAFCAISYAEPVENFPGTFKIHNSFQEHLAKRVPAEIRGKILDLTTKEASRSIGYGDYPRASRLIRSGLRAMEPQPAFIENGVLSLIVDVSRAIADAGYVDDVTYTASQLNSTGQMNSAIVASELLNAHCLRRAGRLVEARDCFRAIGQERVRDELPGQFLRARFQSAHVDHLLGDYASAERTYLQIVGLGAQTREDMVTRQLTSRQLADIEMLRGRFRSALLRFDECRTYESNDPLWKLECDRFRAHVLRFNWLLEDAAMSYSAIAERSASLCLRGMEGKALINPC